MKCRGGGVVIEALRSRPIRGAWIEITVSTYWGTATAVAPHTGRVD